MTSSIGRAVAITAGTPASSNRFTPGARRTVVEEDQLQSALLPQQRGEPVGIELTVNIDGWFSAFCYSEPEGSLAAGEGHQWRSDGLRDRLERFLAIVFRSMADDWPSCTTEPR
jgi:hypothetical protein